MRSAPGSVVAPTLEGSRPILVEVQALVAPGPVGTPRRTASGVDPNRVALLIAVLGRRAGIGLEQSRRLRQPRRRPVRSGSRASTCRSPSPSLVASRPARPERNGRDRRGRAARRAAAGAGPRAAPPRGRPARVRPGHRPGPRHRPGRRPGRRGIDVVAVASLREAIEAALERARRAVAGASARC